MSESNDGLLHDRCHVDDWRVRAGKAVRVSERQPQIEHAVFVFRHRKTGRLYAKYLHDPIVSEDEYEHIATLDPALWIMAHYDDAPEMT